MVFELASYCFECKSCIDDINKEQISYQDYHDETYYQNKKFHFDDKTYNICDYCLSKKFKQKNCTKEIVKYHAQILEAQTWLQNNLNNRCKDANLTRKNYENDIRHCNRSLSEIERRDDFPFTCNIVYTFDDYTKSIFVDSDSYQIYFGEEFLDEVVKHYDRHSNNPRVWIHPEKTVDDLDPELRTLSKEKRELIVYTDDKTQPYYKILGESWDHQIYNESLPLRDVINTMRRKKYVPKNPERVRAKYNAAIAAIREHYELELVRMTEQLDVLPDTY